MTFLLALVLLGVLIFVHEFGHFLSAKLLGVRVLKFSLGFGPKLIGRRYGDTEYLISAIPFGGYVKMLGESTEDELKEEEKRFAFNRQPVWKRFFIVFLGPLFNMLFAVVIFIGIFLYGFPTLLPEIGEVLQDSPAERAGLMKGDTIIAIDGSPINRWDEMTKIIHTSPERILTLSIRRHSEVISVTLTPEKKSVKNIFGEPKEVGLIGIKPSGATEVKRENIIGATVNAVVRTWEIVVLTVVAVIKIIQRVIPAETIGGPILIVQMAGEQAAIGFMNFFLFMAIININLGILNLLPIPILDGGHILFLGIEVIRGKPLSEKAVAIAQRVGLAIILTIMAFALYNDIIRIVTGKPLP